MKKNNLNINWGGIAILFLFLTVFVSPAYAQRSTISGYVFGPQRTPITEIPVELMNDFNSVLQRVKTDGAGRFFFRGVSSGRFSIRVLPLGTDYEEQIQDVEISGMGVNGRPLSDNIQIDFYLRSRKTASPTVNGVIFVQDIPEPARKVYENAISDLKSEKVELGTKGLENALELFPTYYLALEKLGTLYISQQKYENARSIFSRAVAVNSNSFNSWYGLGYANYSLKQPKAAVEAAQKAVSLSPNSIDGHLFLGISFRQAKQYPEAEKSLKQAEKISKGKSADVHWNLALLYAHNLKRYNDAADELELYLKVDPKTSNAEEVKKLIKQFRNNQTSSN